MSVSFIPCGLVARLMLLLLALVYHDAKAEFADGVAAYRRGEYAAAFSEFTIAAARNNLVAQNVLGTMYAEGLGVERNDQLAIDWFLKAQARGSAEAMANLAKMYALGRGVAQNNTTALQYYGDAALSGFQPAILRMAEIYEKGELGVTPDKELALGWRARLRAVQSAAANVSAGAVRAAEKVDPSRMTKVAPMPKPSSPEKVAHVRVDRTALFEKQVFGRLENYRQRERKLFVSSTDETQPIAAYLKELRVQLASRLGAAFSASRPDERMIVSLSIRRDGTLRDLELSRSSGNPRTDSRVLSSLKTLERLQPLPAVTADAADILVVTVRLPIE